MRCIRCGSTAKVGNYCIRVAPDGRSSLDSSIECRCHSCGLGFSVAHEKDDKGVPFNVLRGVQEIGIFPEAEIRACPTCGGYGYLLEFGIRTRQAGDGLPGISYDHIPCPDCNVDRGEESCTE